MIAMTALLMEYSCAGLVEEGITRRRPEYEDSIRRTNGFFLGPPRRL